MVEELPAEERRLLAERKQGRLFGGSDETGGEQQASNTGENLSPIARKILGLLKVETATHIDDLLERAEDVSSSEVIAALFELELLGVVRQLPGKNFAKVW